MKYVVASKARPGGSVKDIEEAVPRLLELFSKWTPPEGMTVHQMVDQPRRRWRFHHRGDRQSGRPGQAASTFGPYYEFQINPVIDFAEAVPAVQKGMEYRNSI